MLKIKLFIILIFISFSNANIITPSDVYSEAMQIQKELKLIKKHFNIDKKVSLEKINTKLYPRHAWQKSYEILLKINILRTSNNMPINEPSNLEPVLNLDPILTYEQIQRIITEIRIFKVRVNIPTQITSKKIYTNKTPLDVYNLLDNISHELDIINKNKFSPSNVFGETIRIYKDLETILNYLNIENNTIPTTKKINAKPIDSFNTSLKILEKLQYIQSIARIDTINAYVFKKEIITPSEVFSLNQIIIAELQTIKAYLGLNNYITPAAKQYTNKTPSDVEQMLGWCLREISLIKSLIPKEEIYYAN